MTPGDLLIIPPQMEYGIDAEQIAIYLGTSPGRREGFTPAHRILTSTGKVLQLLDLESAVVNLSEQENR